MTRRSTTLACAAVALLAGACNDKAYLTEQPFDFVPPANFYKTSADALAAVNGVYAAFINSSGDNYYGRNFVMLVEYPTEMVTTYLSATNERSLVDNYTFTPQQSYIFSTWSSAYTAINRANSVIGRVPAIPMDTTLRNRIVGEAKFLRALNYFNLVRLFGDVPLHVKETTGLDSLQSPRAPAADVYARIVLDLRDAIVVLPKSYSGTDVGRATNGAAKTLLAKVYLQRAATLAGGVADDQSALDLLNDVQATGGYSLLSDYSFLFDMQHETNSEVIFDIQNIRAPNLGGRLSSYMAPRNSNYGGSQNGAFEAEQPFFDAFAPADSLRKWVTFQRSFTNKAGATISWDVTANQGASKPYGADTPYPNKFLDRQSAGAGLDEPNYIILRYADNLLMQAEAINEISGPLPAAYAAINAVRTRPALAGKPSIGNLVAGLSQAAFRDSVFAQRRLELALEGPNGYFDSQRNWTWAKARVAANMALGKATSFKTSKYPKAQVTLDDHFRLMPIPQHACDVNPALVQNPGYTPCR